MNVNEIHRYISTLEQKEEDLRHSVDNLIDQIADLDRQLEEAQKTTLSPEVDELLILLEGYIAEKEAQMRAGYRCGSELTRIVELYRAVRPIKKEVKSA